MNTRPSTPTPPAFPARRAAFYLIAAAAVLDWLIGSAHAALTVGPPLVR